MGILSHMAVPVSLPSMRRRAEKIMLRRLRVRAASS